MQLRKVCDHPWLMPGAEEISSGETTEEIVEASGKLKLLDRMLKKLKAGGHRVVLFSQFTSMLDILEDYLELRGYEFVRLDGSTNRYRRRINIQRFNEKNSKLFIFLMSTRAGGLGINAQTADTVILYDSDWNPQVDLQAMGRVHRIGQTKMVHIYRLVARNSVEERIIARAEKKLYLDKMVNRDSTRQGMEMEKLGIKEVMKLLRFGANAVFHATSAGANELSDDAIDRIIKRDGNCWTGEEESRFEEATVSAAEFDPKQAPLAIRSHAEVGGSARQSFRDIANSWKVEKRKRQSRIVKVDGHSILRENNYTMQEGGISAAGRVCRVATSYEKTGREWMSSSECLICWDGGKLLCCDHCPAVFHAECLHAQGFAAVGTAFNKNEYKCPQHSCTVCGRVASSSGGMLLRCTECPKAYCEEHEPKDVDFNCGGVNERFDDLEYPRSSSRYYIQCSSECVEFYKNRTQKSVEFAVSEHRRLHPPEEEAASQDYVEPSFPPPHSIALQQIGRVVDYDGARWFIAKENQTPGTIAHICTLDARVLCKQNAAIVGLTQKSKLKAGTALLIGSGDSKRVKEAPVYASSSSNMKGKKATAAATQPMKKKAAAHPRTNKKNKAPAQSRTIERPVKPQGKFQLLVIYTIASLRDRRGSTLYDIKRAIASSLPRDSSYLNKVVESLVSKGLVVKNKKGRYFVGTQLPGGKRQRMVVHAILKSKNRRVGLSLKEIKRALKPKLAESGVKNLKQVADDLVTKGFLIKKNENYLVATAGAVHGRASSPNENVSGNVS